MSRTEIVEQLARAKTVEGILARVAKHPVEGDMYDLVQEVYLTLLTYDEQKLCGLYERGELRWFVTRIVINQYASATSPFYYLYKRRYRKLDTTNGCAGDPRSL